MRDGYTKLVCSPRGVGDRWRGWDVEIQNGRLLFPAAGLRGVAGRLGFGRGVGVL